MKRSEFFAMIAGAFGLAVAPKVEEKVEAKKLPFRISTIELKAGAAIRRNDIVYVRADNDKVYPVAAADVADNFCGLALESCYRDDKIMVQFQGVFPA